MKRLRLLAVLGLSLLCMFAVKKRYGGEISIYLNEPYSFHYINDDYSSVIFYSFIYENFFHLSTGGEISTHLFEYHLYDQDRKTLEIKLKEHLSFSDGSPVTARSITHSINEFIKLETSDSKALSRVLKGIRSEGRVITLLLNYDFPDIAHLLTAPQLVLLSPVSAVFSGAFIPSEWIKGEHLILTSNPFYPGGRSYLDRVRVIFAIQDEYPDVFLSTLPEIGRSFNRKTCGIYENAYVIFPDPNTPPGNKQALYTLLKDFGESQSLKSLDVLTSETESPVVIDIRGLSLRQAKRTLMYSKINLYFFPSFKSYQDAFSEYLASRDITLKTFFLDSKMRGESISSEDLDYIVLQKSFQKATPLKDKVKRIVGEMLFSRYNEEFMLRVKEMDELYGLNKNELLMDKIAALITDIVNEGIIYPLFQKEYYLYYRKRLVDLSIDYYGKPRFDELRYRTRDRTDE